MGNVDFKEKTRSKTKAAPKEPSLYNVIYLNDEVTTVEFVVESLVAIFDYDAEDALKMANTIHAEGSAVVATLPYEIAEQKGVEATVLARDSGFPLQIRLAPDE